MTLFSHNVPEASIRVQGALTVRQPIPTSLDVKPEDRVVPTFNGQVTQGTVLTMQLELNPAVSRKQFEARNQTRLKARVGFEVRAIKAQDLVPRLPATGVPFLLVTRFTPL